VISYYLALSERSIGQVDLSCVLHVRTRVPGTTGHARDRRPINRRKQAISLAMQGNHVPDTYLRARARLPATRYDRSIIFFFHTRPIRDRSMRHAWSSIHDFVQRRSRLVLTYMQWRLELRVCRRRSREAVESTATIVPRPRYIIFFLR
jgi:hypothetical protein